MSRNLSTRLHSLERLYQRGKCLTCFNHPVRIVGVEDGTDALISETFPASGCPSCGCKIRHTIEVVGTDVLEV